MTLPSDFDILRPCFVEHEAVRQHRFVRRATAGAAGLQQ